MWHRKKKLLNPGALLVPTVKTWLAERNGWLGISLKSDPAVLIKNITLWPAVFMFIVIKKGKRSAQLKEKKKSSGAIFWKEITWICYCQIVLTWVLRKSLSACKWFAFVFLYRHLSGQHILATDKWFFLIGCCLLFSCLHSAPLKMNAATSKSSRGWM